MIFWVMYIATDNNHPSWSCMEVFQVFVSCLTLFTFRKFLYEAYKLLYVWDFDCFRDFLQTFSMQHTKSQCSRHISIVTNISMKHVKFSMLIFKFCMQSKFGHRDVIIYSIHGFSIVPPDNFHMEKMFLIT